VLEKMEDEVGRCARHPQYNREYKVVVGVEFDRHVFIGHDDQADVVEPDVIAVETDRPCLFQTDPQLDIHQVVNEEADLGGWLFVENLFAEILHFQVLNAFGGCEEIAVAPCL